MRVKTNIFCLALVLLSWMLASGMISCKVEVASGPVAVSRSQALSDVVVRARAFGMSVMREVIGKVDVKPAMQTGLPIQAPWEHITQVAISVASFLAAVLPVAYLLSQMASPDSELVSEDLEALAPHMPQVSYEHVQHDQLRCHEAALSGAEMVEMPRAPIASQHEMPSASAAAQLPDPGVQGQQVICQQAPSLKRPLLDIERAKLRSDHDDGDDEDDDDTAIEAPSAQACAAAYRGAPMVVGALGRDNVLLPALHALEPCLQLRSQ